MPRSRVGTTFHETYPLDRSRLSEFLHGVETLTRDTHPDAQCAQLDQIEAITTLSRRSLRAPYPNWGFATGLTTTTERCSKLSDFGASVLRYDRALQRPQTQWLMHYHLTSPIGPGPVLWNHIWGAFYNSSAGLSRSVIDEIISSYIEERAGTAAKQKSVTEASTAMLQAYLTSSALGNLGMLIERTLVSAPTYHLRRDPIFPPREAFGYALIHYWERAIPNRMTADVDHFLGPGHLASVFAFDRETFLEYLGRIGDLGLVDTYRVAHPYQVVRLWGAGAADSLKASLLDGVYVNGS